MKKFLGIVIVLGIVAGLVALFMPSQKEEAITVTTAAPVGDPAQYFPADTGFYYHLSHIQAITKAFPKSPAGRLFSKETLLSIMQEMQVSPEKMQKFEDDMDRRADFLASSHFQALFGDSITWGVLPLDLDAIAADCDGDITIPRLFSALEPYVVFISTPPAPVTLQTFAAINPAMMVTQEEIDGLTLIKVSRPEKGPLLYGYIDGNHVLFSPSSKAIQICVNSKKTGNNLRNTPYLAQSEQYWANYPADRTYYRIYMNIESVLQSFNAVKDPGLTETFAKLNIKDFLDLYQGFEYTAGLLYTTDQTLESPSMVSFNLEKLHPAMKAGILGAEKGKKNTGLHLLDRHPLFYYCGMYLNLGHAFNHYKKDPAMAEKVESGVQEILGLSTTEIAEALGPQHGFTLDTIVNDGIFPIPTMSFWVDARNPATVKKALNHVKQLSTEKGKAPGEEQVAGSTMLHWLLMPGDAGQPAVALHKDTLYLTTSVSLMRAILNNSADPAVVPQKARERLGAELSARLERADGFAVGYPGQFAEPLQNIIEFGNKLHRGGDNPVQTIKKELGIFLKSMDHVTYYCNVEGNRMNCVAAIKWAPPATATRSE
ncbi:hypothetical protein LJC22_04390 [Desulfosarcina sp. OttesenSCG-928-G10]|nr:hypothetical protein [Desulfosarcina sp. OttesenSCG-928-G10]